MATYYLCPQDLVNGACPVVAVPVEVDNDLATALQAHAVALDNNTAAMNEFFSLDVATVGMISAAMLAMFITGNSTGKVAAIMRKS